MLERAWWFESTRGHLKQQVEAPWRVPDFSPLGRLAQLVRAAALHAVGQGFESLVAHLPHALYWPAYLLCGYEGLSLTQGLPFLQHNLQAVSSGFLPQAVRYIWMEWKFSPCKSLHA